MVMLAEFSPLAPPQEPAGLSRQDSGIGFSKTSTTRDQDQATPSPTNATPTSVPSEISTASSSSNLYRGLSALWVQLLVSRLVLHLHGSDELRASSARSPSGRAQGRGSQECTPIRVSLEVESASMQLDVQERCADVTFKISSVECNFLKLLSNAQTPPPGCGQWVPYLDHSNGKLFSTTNSNLPDEVLQATAPVSPSVSHAPKFLPSFLCLKCHLPRGNRITKAGIKVQLSVSSFEAVMWLPVFKLVQTVVASDGGSVATPPSQVRGHHYCTLCTPPCRVRGGCRWRKGW